MRKLSRILPALATMVLLLGLVSVADAQGRLPRPPINVQATVTDERVTLTWQGNPGDYTVDGYRIERYEGHRSVWEVLVPFQPAANNTPGNNPNTLETYVDTVVLPSTPYRYRIRSVNEQGISRGYAGVDAETAVDPPGLRILSDHGRVTIEWDAPEDDSITGYRILRRVQWGPEETVLSDTGLGNTGWVDRGVSPGTAYAYRLQALHDERPGARSRYLFALTPRVATPTVVVSEPDGQNLAAGTETTGRLSVGGSVTGTIDSLDDRDWFAVEMEAGQAYHARLRIMTEDGLRPFANGRVVLGCLMDADGADSPDQCLYKGRVDFEARQTGTHYIVVQPRWYRADLGHPEMPAEYELELDQDVDLPQDSSLPAPYGALRTSSDVDVGTWVSGHLHNGDRADNHRVQLCEDRLYRVPVFFDYGPDADGVVANAGAVRIGTGHGNSRWTDASPHLFRASRTGTHYLRVAREPDISTIYASRHTYYYREATYKFLVEEADIPAEPPDLTPVPEPANGDLPADTSTTGLVPFGNTVTGNIGSGDDRDWFRVRFNDALCDERTYWLELNGADTGDGTLEDPRIIGIYDAKGTHIPNSHIGGQWKTYDNDSGYGRNAITDFTPPGRGDYFVEVAGYQGSTGTYTLSVRDITDTSTSIPADDVAGKKFANWFGFRRYLEDAGSADELVGNLAPGIPATIPAHDPDLRSPEELHEYEEDYVIPETNQGGDAGDSDLFRLRVVLSRNYRLELRLPETTDGRPADVGIQFLSAYQPHFDLGEGDVSAVVFRIGRKSTLLDGEVSLEFRARQFIEVEGRLIPDRLHAAFHLGEYHFEPRDLYTMVLTDITASGDDYLGAYETTGAVAVGGSVTGNIEVDNDVDWFRVRLETGKSYRIRMSGAESGGGTLSDPYVSIEGERGASLPFGFENSAPQNDDKSETEKDSELVVTVLVTGAFFIGAATPGSGTGTYTIEVEEVTPQNQQSNTPATGWPAVSGTVRVGETLTATTDGIEDEDGLTGAVFAYQWVRRDLTTNTDTDIPGAMGSTYTVTGEDAGKAIKVRVTFTDDEGNDELLTSNAMLSTPPLVIPDEDVTPESSEAREAEGEQETPLTATIHDAPESHDGQEDFSFELRFSEEPKEDFSYKTLKDHAFTVTRGTVDGARRLEDGSNIRWEISVSPESNGDITVVLPITTDCTADGAICTDDGRMLSGELKLTVSGPDSQQQAANTPATGEPAISGTARVGETLTADTSGIADEDGLTNVSYSYQWVADDTDIDGATDSSYTLSEDDVGKSIQVQVSFEDDADNEESLTSAATATVAARPSLTASVLNAPQSHNGGDKFTFELRFSEEIEEDFSYETLKDHAFMVTGGTVAGVRRLVSGSNIRWEITVSPDSNSDVTVKLPATEDCGAQGAICTDDGRMLSEGLEFTVSRPGS